MIRKNRQIKIKEIIAKYDVDTQEGLLELLKKEGYDVTQATISRDIKELGIVKALTPDGSKYKYVLAEKQADVPREENKLKSLIIFKNAVISIKCSQALIVIQTTRGGAQACADYIDKLSFEEVLGTLAGENTLFVATDSSFHAEAIRDKLQALLSSDYD